METGEIFFWNTDKVQGRDTRRKYHIFICGSDWKEDRNTFLFISSNNYFNDFQINQKDWAVMPKTDSFISCVSPVFYYDSDLKRYEITRTGSLTVQCMRRLALHIQDSDSMERRHISRVVAALHAACK